MEFVKGFISTFIEGLISLFVGFIKQMVKIVKEGVRIFVKSAKILFGAEGVGMTPAQKGDAIIKVLGGGLLTISGVAIDALLNRLGIGSPLSVVISTLVAGIGSTFFMYILDKLDLFSVKAEQRKERIDEIFQLRIAEIKTDTEKLDSEALALLTEQRTKFDTLVSQIETDFHQNDLDQMNSGLYSLAKFFDIKLPYEDTGEFIAYFEAAPVLEF